MSSRNRNLLIIAIGALLVVCFCCAIAGGVGAYLMIRPVAGPELSTAVVTRYVTAVVPRPAATATPVPPAKATPRPGVDATATAAPAETPEPRPLPQGTPVSIPTLDAEAAALAASEMPAADQRALALRLQPDVQDIPMVVNASAPSYQVGDKSKFWISNSDTQEHRQITAELKYMTDHVGMWVEEGVRLDQRDLEASAKRFEEKTYPTNREFFGSEWSPGVDNDERLHILHARGLGETVAGYYSSADEYSRLVNEYSNEREMFYISADSGNAPPNSAFYDGTLAHEFQHMIHWANDRNETSWVNEGMSELASLLNGFDPGGHDYAYAVQPDTQLTTWGDPSQGNSEHYGASYLFTAYFLGRFGEELTKAVVSSPKNGTAGYNEALEKAGQTERFDDIFADWVIANYLDMPDAEPAGRFGYAQIDTFPMAVAETHRSFPASAKSQVSQYGVDYIRLRGSGPVTIDFEGQAQVPIVDATIQGSYTWWSNRGDQSNSTLTRAFDLRNVTAATLNFSAWYNIEEGWDYAYVEASTDGGKRWQILDGRHTTDSNPVGNAFGIGWTGISGGGSTPRWIDEQVDLTPYVGKEILVRFEMVTDDAVNEPGLLIDNIAIPEIGFSDDGEAGPQGWTAEGWILTDNSVAQRWLVQLVMVSGNRVDVERVDVGPDGRGQLTVTGLGDDETILAISALAPVTTEPAEYSYSVTQ